jgi:hypothetical protein
MGFFNTDALSTTTGRRTRARRFRSPGRPSHDVLAALQGLAKVTLQAMGRT